MSVPLPQHSAVLPGVLLEPFPWVHPRLLTVTLAPWVMDSPLPRPNTGISWPGSSAAGDVGKAVGLWTSESGGRFPANEVQLAIQWLVVKSLLNLLFVP